MRYYINGQETTPAAVKAFCYESAQDAGMEVESWLWAWQQRNRSEEAREFINEISGYVVEMYLA